MFGQGDVAVVTAHLSKVLADVGVELVAGGCEGHRARRVCLLGGGPALGHF